LEIEDFELKQNYLVYLESVDIIKEAQRYEIDWEKMGVVHKLDKN
jgi:hypothetical protein